MLQCNHVNTQTYSHTNSKHWFYDILPSNNALFSYAIGSRKLPANEHFLCVCSNSSKFVTNLNKARCIIYSRQQFTPAQIKPQSFELRWNSFFSPGMDESHIYLRPLALGCFYSHISTRTFRRALTASLDSCIESAPSVA